MVIHVCKWLLTKLTRSNNHLIINLKEGNILNPNVFIELAIHAPNKMTIFLSGLAARFQIFFGGGEINGNIQPSGTHAQINIFKCTDEK